MTQPLDPQDPRPDDASTSPEPAAPTSPDDPTVAWTPLAPDGSDATLGADTPPGSAPLTPDAAPPSPADAALGDAPPPPPAPGSPPPDASSTSPILSATPAAGAPIVGWESPDAALAPSVREGFVTAGIGARLVAWIIDIFIVGLVATIIFALIIGVTGGSIAEDATTLALLYSIVALGVEFLYFVGFWTSGMQATLGMRLLALRVVEADDGSTLEIGPAVIRFVAYGLPLSILALLPGVLGVIGSYGTTGWSIVLLLTTAMHPAHRGLHDRWAGSAVVRRADASNNAAVVGCLVIGLILIGLFIVLPIVVLIALGPQMEEILSQVGESI